MSTVERLGLIKIEGFRSIRKLELNLGQLTVLIGANGSGKSNFIGFFNLMSFMLAGDLQTYIARKGYATSILHYGPKRTPFLKIELDFEGPDTISQYGSSLVFASPDRLIFTEEQVRFHRTGSTGPYRKTLSSGQTETDLLALANGTQNTTARTVARIFVNRLRGLQVYHFHDTSETAYLRTTQDIDRNRFLLSNGGNLTAFLYRLRERWPAHFNHILATIRLTVPYLKELILEPDGLNPSRIQMRWRDRNTDYEFGPHQFSDGSLRAIALITALLQPEELLPTVIFMDEPELGLHPSALSVVADLIKSVSEKRQVVLSTQSSGLVAKFQPEDVVVVERLEDDQGFGESTFKRLSREELGTWLDDYDLGALHEMNVTGGGPR